MGRRGRPRRPGRRTANDKPVRLVTLFDKGSDRVQAMRERYREHYNSAIGRAYAAHLLGDEEVALIRYQAGKRFQRAVERFFTVGAIRCTLGAERRSGGAVAQLVAHPFDEAEWQWVCAKADDLDQHGYRPWLDQLTLSLYHDGGPIWLDRLLAGGKDPADLMVLKTCIGALDLIAPEQPRHTIHAIRC